MTRILVKSGKGTSKTSFMLGFLDISGKSNSINTIYTKAFGHIWKML